jgi:phosphoglycolate phosphatase-like HAD superfamily hydrolase
MTYPGFCMTKTDTPFSPDIHLEWINHDMPRCARRAVLFDFDGTLSLIREGWQQVMIPMMIDELRPWAKGETEEELNQLVRTYVTRLTGKQTIYQMIELARQIEERGGTPKEPLAYKYQYLDLLWQRISHRVHELKSGTADPDEHLVPGARKLLECLHARKIPMILASGTDHPYVVDEAEALKIDHFFEGRIYGALDEYKKFSKAIVIQRILKEHQLQGPELLSIGDGYVEIENCKEVGGTAIGAATEEHRRTGIDEWKRGRLIEAGADVIIPDFLGE